MCRGNPNNPASTPGGTAAQTFTAPDNARSISDAIVQIDPDAQTTAHAVLYVNGARAGEADATPTGDTHFSFGSIAVPGGASIALPITFTATAGKIITVYTVGSPGGRFTATNSCSAGAPGVYTSEGLRAVISGTAA